MDQELLQAIGGMIDEKLAAQTQEIDKKLAAQTQEIDKKLAAQTQEIDKKLAAQTQEIDKKLAAQTQEVKRYMEETREDALRETRLMMENYFDPKFNLLAENQQIMMEKLKGLDDLEVLDTRVSALEAMVKKINRELKELKKAQ